MLSLGRRDTRTIDATAKHSANGAPRIAAADRISNDAYACVSGDSEDSEARRIVYSWTSRTSHRFGMFGNLYDVGAEYETHREFVTLRDAPSEDEEQEEKREAVATVECFLQNTKVHFAHHSTADGQRVPLRRRRGKPYGSELQATGLGLDVAEALGPLCSGCMTALVVGSRRS